MAAPTPAGVPVAITSPGTRVIPADSAAISVGMAKIIWLTGAACRTSPLTLSSMAPLSGLVSAAAGTMGLIGAE